MIKNFILYTSSITLLITTSQSSSAMHQLARPALAQSSAQIAAISPKLTRKYSQTTPQENNTISADNHSNATPKIDRLNEQNLDKLIEELIVTSERKDLLLTTIKKLAESQQIEDFYKLQNLSKDELVKNLDNKDVLREKIEKVVENQEKEDLCTLIEALTDKISTEIMISNIALYTVILTTFYYSYKVLNGLKSAINK